MGDEYEHYHIETVGPDLGLQPEVTRHEKKAEVIFANMVKKAKSLTSARISFHGACVAHFKNDTYIRIRTCFQNDCSIPD